MIVGSNRDKKFLLITIAVLMVAGLLFLPIAAESLWWREVFNSGHTVFFLVISFVLYFWLLAAFPFISTEIMYLAVLFLMLLFGVAIELIQSGLHREASMDDLYKDFYGIISGLGFVMFVRQKKARNRIFSLVFSFAILFLGVGSLFQLGWHYVQRDSAFPVLVDFDKNWSASFVRFNNTELLGHANTERTNNEGFYRIRFDVAQYPGVSVIEPEENWSGFNRLHFDVYSDNASDIEMVLRIHDQLHTQAHSDRFNKVYVIRHGLNKIDVNLTDVRKAPIDRELDLMNIAGVEFFLINSKTSVFLEVSNIFLAF